MTENVSGISVSFSQKMNRYQTLNYKLNIDEPPKAIKVFDFLFFLLFLDK